MAYLERDSELSIAADPFDTPDPEHGNLKFTWWYDDVRAGAALFAAGGGSRRSVAVLDTGLDVNHPEFAGSGRIARTYETNVGGQDVTDAVGHGTFVTGLIAAVDGNGVGTKGVAGNTQILAIRASANGSFTERDLLRGIDFTLRRGGDVLNLSLAGDGLGRSVGRALATAFLNDVLPVAASGNKAQNGNPIQFPAALLGGRRGDPGIGLSVAATRPDGSVGAFSTHNEYVSLAAPGASAGDCRFGVFSTLPATVTDWDDLGLVPDRVQPGRRALCLRRGHELRRPDRLRHRRAGVADRAPAGLRAGGRGDDPLGAPDARHGLERVHGHGDRRRRRRHGAGAHLRRDRPARQGQRATCGRPRPRARAPVARPHRAGPRTRRRGALRAARVPQRRPHLRTGAQRAPAPDRPQHPPARLARARVRGRWPATPTATAAAAGWAACGPRGSPSGRRATR